MRNCLQISARPSETTRLFRTITFLTAHRMRGLLPHMQLVAPSVVHHWLHNVGWLLAAEAAKKIKGGGPVEKLTVGVVHA